MKKTLKIIIIIVVLLLLFIAIDIGSIFLRNKPLFALSKTDAVNNNIYYGLLYNTYDCQENLKPIVKVKWEKYSCNNSIVIGKIIDIKDEYVIINGLSDNNYLKANIEAHINLTNNPMIEGANNLIIGQYLKIIPESIKELNPIIITTNKIEIIYEKDIDY